MPMNDKQFLEIAEIVAKTSKCVSLKVGCVLVRDGRILSTGFNGTPAGFKNCCAVHDQRGEAHTEWSLNFEVHGEQNCLLYAARNGISTEGCTLYTTIEPCHQCVKMLITAGIKRVVFSEVYYREGLDSANKEWFAQSCGMSLEHYTSESITACPAQGYAAALRAKMLSTDRLSDTSEKESSRPWAQTLAGWATLGVTRLPTPSLDTSSSEIPLSGL